MMLGGAIRDGCTLSAWGLYLLWKSAPRDSGDAGRTSTPGPRDFSERL
jgi:hypothetical protein